jgi:hypothetical protein
MAEAAAPPPLLDRLVPPADKAVAGWHVSPFVDLAAYHFSWLFILVPLALSGDVHPKDYLGLWALGMTLSFLHRHFTMPYVYLDKEVYRQHVTRFSLFAGLMMIAFVASAFLFKWKAPKGFFQPIDVALVVAGVTLVAQSVVADRRAHRFSVRALVAVASPFVVATTLGIAGLYVANHVVVDALVLAGFSAASIVAGLEIKKSEAERASARATLFSVVVVAVSMLGLASLAMPARGLNAEVVKGSGIVGIFGVVAATWNIWHTLMQKFGILRMYAAKSSVPLEKRTPPWVDRLMLFGMFPFLALWLGPAQRETIASQSKSVTQYLMPVIDGLEAVQPWLLPPAALLALAGIGCFFVWEYRADRWQTRPRVWMGIALTLLNACFLFLSPLKVYAAYGFSHAIEYMVFVWAFLRRRYAQPQPHHPPIERWVKHPVVSWGTFILVIGLFFFVIQYGDDYGLHTGIKIFDIKIGTWLFTFAIWHSMVHFYFDGFLWKMRAAQVRASL